MAVYFIRAGENGPVKIGFALKIPVRLSKMQADNHEELHVVRVISGDTKVEREVHKEFAALRFRGEWFHFDPRMMAYGQAEDWLPEQRFWFGDNHPDIINRVFTATKGPLKLARILGITQAAVSQWQRVPAERVGKVSTATGIPLHELRPDLFETS